MVRNVSYLLLTDKGSVFSDLARMIKPYIDKNTVFLLLQPHIHLSLFDCQKYDTSIISPLFVGFSST